MTNDLTKKDIIFAKQLDAKGSASNIEINELSKNRSASTLTWLHIPASSSLAKEYLRDKLDIPTSIIDNLFQDDTRPTVQHYKNGTYINLRGLNFNQNSHIEDMVSIRIWISNTIIVTVRKRRLMSIQDLLSAFKKGHGPKTPGDFIEFISDRLHDRMNNFMTELDEKTDSIEETIDNGSASTRELLKDIRMSSIKVRRYMDPQRDALKKLTIDPNKYLSEHNLIELNGHIDILNRFIENIDLIRERAKVLHDEITVMSSDRLNRNMYLLSIIAAIFLPLGFLTGLFGINVGGIPGSDNPDAFLVFTLGLSGIAVVMLLLFRFKKWL